MLQLLSYQKAYKNICCCFPLIRLKFRARRFIMQTLLCIEWAERTLPRLQGAVSLLHYATCLAKTVYFKNWSCMIRDVTLCNSQLASPRLAISAEAGTLNRKNCQFCVGKGKIS